MTGKLSIRWRIGAIFLVGLLAILSALAALYYASQGLERTTALPQPQQLAAIVELIESTPPDRRASIFAAFRSSQLSVRVAPEAEVATELPRFWPEGDAQAERYQAVLGERAFANHLVTRGFIRRGPFNPLQAAELRVQLKNDGVLIVAVDGLAMVTRQGFPIGFPGAVIGVIAAFIALVLLNREFRPVLRLARAVDAIDPSDMDARLPALRAGTAEVRALIDAFDRQQDRVATMLRARSVFIGGIHHDVRTFATRLRLRVEKMPDTVEREKAEADIADLVSLMDSALLATRSESHELNLELIDVVDFVEAEVRGWQTSGEPVRLAVQVPRHGIQLIGDRLALRRIVSNLVDNGLRYGRAVHISIETEGGDVALIFDDEGPGIPPDRRLDLMEPFARAEPSRSRETGGAGLGLAIVGNLVNGHNGRLDIKDAPTGGARLIVRIPRFDNFDT